MALPVAEQFLELIKSKAHVLITFRPDASGDAVGSALALSFFIESLGKRADIVSADFVVPPSLRFLPQISTIRSALPSVQKLDIVVDTATSGLKELSYDVRDGKLHIFVTPKQGRFDAAQVHATSTALLYDAVIVLDTPERVQLGSVFHNQPELFHDLPVVVIDYRGTNDRYGHLNIVDITKTSTSEVVYELLAGHAATPLSAASATCLLAGIIAKTRSFKETDLTPQALRTASELIAHGADRRTIVQELFHTRSVATLKLWGEMLTHIRHEHDLGMLTTTVSKDTLERSGGTAHDIAECMHELLSTTREASAALVLFPSQKNPEQEVDGLYFSTKNGQGLTLFSPFSPSKLDKQTHIRVPAQSLEQAYILVMTHLRNTQQTHATTSL